MPLARSRHFLPHVMMISRIFLLCPSHISWVREFGQCSEAQGGIPGAVQSQELGSVILMDPFQLRIFHSSVWLQGQGEGQALLCPLQTPPAAPGIAQQSSPPWEYCHYSE